MCYHLKKSEFENPAPTNIEIDHNHSFYSLLSDEKTYYTFYKPRIPHQYKLL